MSIRRSDRDGRRRILARAAVALLLGLIAGARPGDDPPTIVLRDDRTFAVEGLDPAVLGRLGPEAFRSAFVVAVDGLDEPMLGKHSVDGDSLRFTPRYAPRPGVRYRATFRPVAIPGGEPGAAPIVALLEIPRPEPAEPTRVVAVYPTTPEPPENLLRFYLHFSEPMSRGLAYRHLRLLDGEGRTVVAPFLELDEELWDPSETRLTLLIDPGRIKQGLVPREELGPVLEAGKTYVLEVDGSWPDATGRPLGASFRKTFRAGPEDAEPPDPSRWEVQSPRSGTPDPLVVRFPGPLDHALLGRLLTVADAEGEPVVGRVEVEEGETRWTFRPSAPWTPGSYRLNVGTDLEDLAGNAVGRPFEVDVFDRVESRVEARSVTVPFRVE